VSRRALISFVAASQSYATYCLRLGSARRPALPQLLIVGIPLEGLRGRCVVLLAQSQPLHCVITHRMSQSSSAVGRVHEAKLTDGHVLRSLRIHIHQHDNACDRSPLANRHIALIGLQTQEAHLCWHDAGWIGHREGGRLLGLLGLHIQCSWLLLQKHHHHVSKHYKHCLA
jgi:hypothetical protein